MHYVTFVSLLCMWPLITENKQSKSPPPPVPVAPLPEHAGDKGPVICVWDGPLHLVYVAGQAVMIESEACAPYEAESCKQAECMRVGTYPDAL